MSAIRPFPATQRHKDGRPIPLASDRYRRHAVEVDSDDDCRQRETTTTVVDGKKGAAAVKTGKRENFSRHANPLPTTHLAASPSRSWSCSFFIGLRYGFALLHAVMLQDRGAENSTRTLSPIGAKIPEPLFAPYHMMQHAMGLHRWISGFTWVLAGISHTGKHFDPHSPQSRQKQFACNDGSLSIRSG